MSPARKKKSADDEERLAEAAAEEATPAAKGKSLVIVESPAKAKTINKYLGTAFVVKASMGHIRDLPKGPLRDRRRARLRARVHDHPRQGPGDRRAQAPRQVAKNVYLAPDPDREGEAIAWHLAESLEISKDPRVFRVVFNEITKKAILEAFEHPGKVDEHKVDAQQARRVLDRIMGYKLSPLLVEEGGEGPERRPRAVGRGALDRRAREGDPRLRQRGILARHRAHGGRRQAFDAELRKLGEKRIDKNLDETRQGAARRRSARIRSSWSRSRRSPRRVRRRRPSTPRSCSRRPRPCFASARRRP
jgi:hypothetical protein